MQVNLYATFRLIAGARSLELDLPEGITVRQAVDEILARLPDLRPHWVNAQNEIHAHVHGFVNGKDVSTLPQGWETPLQSGDVLDFFPPVAGG
ncbi:molybdopterin synthase subunit MoaD [Bellilinea caldifistulae]|uniref:Molybdenum biosynthesis protein MoaD n=1 Tax=Bellilinea caldifistulae TaxID=360411 RepID=A0A0P6YBG6_9CHLR|nr:ubiquitin-like small modifier protein 1 [Bellilinea caldifistulae]KPL79262.1 molybdenum biosynthesis protein MoaD [Bellilinea caldifistulae]GAP09062.1 molybdopterin synthase subunit MoaD [Bellilinea caldifistulae]